MCFIHIDIFTQSLWLMNKHPLQNNNKNKKRKVLATSAQKQMRPGVSSLPIPFKPKTETVIHLFIKERVFYCQSFLRVNKQIPLYS